VRTRDAGASSASGLIEGGMSSSVRHYTTSRQSNVRGIRSHVAFWSREGTPNGQALSPVSSALAWLALCPG